jgi:hypothetical protein
MSTPIIKYEPPSHPADDPGHPIPSPAALDVVTILRDGGADLFIIVASPLAADHYSLSRLQDKIEGYLIHIQSAEFQAEAGAPTPNSTTIKVLLHPSSSPEAYDFLDRSKDWVLDNHATLKVEQLDLAVH